MRTKIITIVSAMVLCLPMLAGADNANDAHGEPVFHALRLDAGTGVTRREGPIQTWDFKGWVGGDDNRLWLQSEGERLDNTMERAEFWALYSRNITTFWDAQIGLRQDTSPHPDTYLTMGFVGLAPYEFQTEAHLFISKEGFVSFRLREENDLLITQRLITQPYAEINLSAQNQPNQQLGAGFSNATIGIQTRYEITRKFAPYIDLHYQRNFGNTIPIVREDGETADDLIATVGIRLMF